MRLTDTHAHLYAEEFNDDQSEMIQRAIDKGVSRLFLPNIDLDSLSALEKLSLLYPNNCFPMMGLHPCSVKDNYKDQLSIIKGKLFTGKYYGVGEIGIDLYWDQSTFEIQSLAFAEQIEWAIELNLPIVIHCRNSFEQTVKIVEEKKKSHGERLRGVFHCFGGSKGDAERVFALGFYIGIGGVVTFKKSGLDILLSEINLDKVVLETDAPYLAPVPYRGKRNESAYIFEVAQKIADIKQMRIEEIAEITTKNSINLFGI